MPRKKRTIKVQSLLIDRRFAFLYISSWLVLLNIFSPQVVLGGESQSASHTETVPLELSHPDPIPAQIVKPGEDVELQGKVVRNEAAAMAALNANLGVVLKPDGKGSLPARITNVLPDSPMARRGVVVGDRLIGEVAGNGDYTLTVEHDGQGMRFSIRASEVDAYCRAAKDKIAAALQAGGAVVQQTAKGGVNNGPALGAVAVKRPLRSLKDVFENHDLVMIIDRSGSMSTKDCPQSMTRWDWCCNQATDLAAAAAQASSAITTVFFNHEYYVFDHVRPQDIPALFTQYKPVGGTRLGQPLAEQLDGYFHVRAKPLIIAIVTDGMPNDPSIVADVIDQASNQLRYVGEVTITFLLISNEVDEQSLRAKLGERMGGSVQNGGMVDVIPFTTLLAKGVKQAFFEELRDVRLATDRTKPSKAGQFHEITSNPGLMQSSFGASGGAAGRFGFDPVNAATRERSDLERALLNKYR